jgi:hypothetical protein
MHFYVSPACSFMATAIADEKRGQSVKGYLFANGEARELDGGEIRSEWDEHGYVKNLDFRTSADGVDYAIHGDVLSLIPLRNRRETPDGQMLVTRITEGMTAYTCNGAPALGMSEYLDQIVDGRPVGI